MLITLLSVCVLCSVPKAEASIRFPYDVFSVNRIEAAQKEAREQKKPVAYLYTDQSTKCPIVAEATEAFLKALDRRCVLVYIPVSSSKFALPFQLREALKEGKFYPKLVLTASDGSKEQCFTYDDYKEDEQKTLRDIKWKVTELSRK